MGSIHHFDRGVGLLSSCDPCIIFFAHNLYAVSEEEDKKGHTVSTTVNSSRDTRINISEINITELVLNFRKEDRPSEL
jgi:hypothetical protein